MCLFVMLQKQIPIFDLKRNMHVLIFARCCFINGISLKIVPFSQVLELEVCKVQIKLLNRSCVSRIMTHPTHSSVLHVRLRKGKKDPVVVSHSCEQVWPSGKGVGLVNRMTSVQFRFGSRLSLEVMVSGHWLVTLSLTANETLN